LNDKKPFLVPGSVEARQQNCCCPKDQPRLFMGVYTMEKDCPVHGYLFPYDDNGKSKDEDKQGKSD